MKVGGDGAHAGGETPPLPAEPGRGSTKTTFRAWARQVRGSLMNDRARAEALSAATVAGIRRSPHYLSATKVLTYLAFGSEIDLDSLTSDPTKRFLITRMEESEESGLSVHELGRTKLERHPFGLLQPVAGGRAVELEEVDLVLVPGLVFDLAGHRLGYGKGLYDRLLPRLRPEVPRFGIAHSLLLINQLPHDAHDAPMTHLATEEGVRIVRPSSLAP